MNLVELLDRSNDTESEEFHKNLVSDFLKRTYYHPNHFNSTKERNDLVGHKSNFLLTKQKIKIILAEEKKQWSYSKNSIPQNG